MNHGIFLRRWLQVNHRRRSEMNFKLMEAIEVLQRTPQTLNEFVSGLSKGWLVVMRVRVLGV